jgi:hypothetical protein
MTYREKVSKSVTRLTGQNPALAAWPVGAVFIGYTATSPATLLRGGTWVQIAQGRMLVGQNPADADFDVVGDTGGAKTVMLAGLNTPDHAHYTGTYDAGTSGAGHTHNLGIQYAQTTTTGGSAYRITDVASAAGGGGTSATAVVSSGGSSHSHGVTGQSGVVVGSTGQTPVNIMNPFLAVYIWRRTA